MRNKKGQFVKGTKPWNTGKHIQTNDALKKWRENGGQSWNKNKTGLYSPPEKSKRKTSESLKKAYKEGRRVSWNKDKKMSEKDKKKMSKIAKKKGFGKWMIGKKLTKETLEKKRKWANTHPEVLRRNGYLGVKKQATMKGPTSIEKKVYEELKIRGLLFEKQKLINGKFLVDAYIPKLNLVIECDGVYWHSLERVKKRDKSKNAYLTKCGFNLLRLSGSEIRDNSFKEKLSKVVN